MYSLGIDIGGTKINVGLVTRTDGEVSVLDTAMLEVSGIKNVCAEIRETAEALCVSNNIAMEDISCCGVGIPGTVSADGRKILKAPNISVLSEDFASALEDALKIPVRMLQDSRAAAYGEYLAGAGRGHSSVVCMTLGTGIGTGIVLDGKIYHGALLGAGELGHLPVVMGGRPCGCGKRGCLEKYCAGGGLDITARELLGQGNSARELFAAAKNGDARASAAIEEAIVMLGNAVVAAINLLSPSCILFSGGLSREDAYLMPMIEYVKEHCYSSSGELPLLARAELGVLAPLVGAALYAKA